MSTGPFRKKPIDIAGYNWTFGTDFKTEREVLADCYSKVRSKYEVAEILGICLTTVRVWLKAFGVSNQPSRGAARLQAKIGEYNKKHGTDFLTIKAMLQHCFDAAGSIAGVAVEFGVTHGTASRWLKDCEIDSVAPKRPSKILRKILDIPQEDREQMTYAQVAKAVGCGESGAFRCLVRNNLSFKQLKHYTPLTTERKETIRQARLQGMTYPQIVKKYKVSTVTIAKILNGGSRPSAGTLRVENSVESPCALMPREH